jgi:hypothetical protein
VVTPAWPAGRPVRRRTGAPSRGRDPPALDGLFSCSGNDLDHLGERGFAGGTTSGTRHVRWWGCSPSASWSWAPWSRRSVHYVLPWLLPLLVANARPILGVAAAVAVLVILDRLHRPWLVELQRQGLTDAPRRVWRVQGWRSRRLMDQLATAIQEGRIDSERAAVVFPGRDRKPLR